jgi:hypothetical protein
MSTRKVTSLPVKELTVARQYIPGVQTGCWDKNRLAIDKIIIHTIVGTIAAANSRFNNPDQVVSAHYGIGLDGSIYHWVDEDNVAYHSGKYAVNQTSIGIEHEDNGNYNGTRTDALYKSSAQLVRNICEFYNIPIDRKHIIKHNEVPYPTACPDNLDIDRIVKEAAAIVVKPVTIVEVDQDTYTLLINKATSFDTVADFFNMDKLRRTQVGAGNDIVANVQKILDNMKMLGPTDGSIKSPDMTALKDLITKLYNVITGQ